MVTFIGVLLIVMAVFLVIAVLMQSSKDHRHGGTVAGGAETFFGKNKGKSLDAMFNKLTTVVAIIFVLLVIILYVIQPEPTIAPVVPETETTEHDHEEAADGAVEGEEAPVEGEVVEDEEAPVEGEEVEANDETAVVEENTPVADEEAAETTEGEVTEETAE